jgi:hypothetical protein
MKLSTLIASQALSAPNSLPTGIDINVFVENNMFSHPM